MRQRSMAGSAGSGFVLFMALILLLLILLVFTIRKHAASQPNAGPPANRHLQH